MSKRYPLDDVFRSKLEHLSTAPPIHVWDQISQRRNWWYRFKNQLRHQRKSAAFLLLLLSGASCWWLWPDQPPIIRSFPIPESTTLPPTLENAVPPPPPSASLFDQTSPVHSPSTYASSPVALSENPGKPYRPNVASMAFVPVPEQPTASASITEPDLNDNDSPLSSVDIIPLLSLEPATVSAETPSLLLFTDDPKCATFQPGQWNLFLSLYGGPDLAFKNMEAKNEEFSGYIQRRTDTESFRYAWNAGLRLSLVSKSGIGIHTGLDYRRLNEEFNLIIENEERITITTIYGSKGEVLGRDTMVETVTRRQVASNRYEWFDFPILLGYEWHKNKLTFALRGGPSINLLLRSEGEILSPENQLPVAYSSSSSGSDALPVFKDKLGIGWYAGFSLNYHLRPGLQLLVEPNLRINPQSITRESFIADQRYTTAGLSVGLRKQI